MSVEMLIAVTCAMIIAMFFYADAQLKNKIHCTFRRPNKTKIMKLVTAKKKHVIFDGGKYNINTKRVTLLWYNKGIHQFRPQWVPSLDFSWDRSEPHDPETFANTWDTPEAREAAQQEESYIAFNKGIDKQIGGKSKLSEMLIPMITIGAIVVVGYLVYQLSGQVAYQGSILQQLINSGGALP